MVCDRYANAISEVLYYLNGICKEDIDKIPKRLIKLFENNKSKDYVCNFDYNKPLKELDLLDETRGIISMICLNYWCQTKEEKQKVLEKLNQNERKYQEGLRRRYNPDSIFKKKDIEDNINYKVPTVENKESLLRRFIKFIKNFLKIK